MDKQIGWYKESENKFYCNDCFQLENMNREEYRPIKCEDIKDDIYTCDNCGKEKSNMENIIQTSNKKYVWSLISLIFIVIFGLSFTLLSLVFPRVIFAVLALLFGIIGWMKKENKIFTLAVIILSSLILIFSIYLLSYVIGPGSAEKRKIANTANVKLFMLDLRPEALIYYSNNNNSYVGLENDSNVVMTVKNLIKYGGKEFNIYISPDGKEFCSEILLPDNSFQCVDSTEVFKNYQNNPKCSSSYYSCE